MDTEDDGILQSQISESVEENEQKRPTSTNEFQEILDATIPVEKGVNPNVEDRDRVEKEDEGGRESIIPAPTSDFQPSADEERVNSICFSGQESNIDTTASSPNQDLHQHPVHKRKPPTRGSHLTKRDKKIIEKIRSYYEAAAEAEEDEAKEGQEQPEGQVTRRRNSFSQIPSGLVRESVSRFDVSGHQGETESGQLKYEIYEVTNRETIQETEPCLPLSDPTSEDTEKGDQLNEPISSLDLDAESSIQLPTSSMIQDKESEDHVNLTWQSNSNSPDVEESETQGRYNKVCKGHEENQEEGLSVIAPVVQGRASLQGDELCNAEQSNCRDETPEASTENQAVTNGYEQNTTHKETSKPETKAQSTWTRTKHRDLAKTGGDLEGLPNQMKVGRWSRHSRIVTANRALFEGMASDVASISLFEASPVVDPVLMENSERILSKVQTLARMYSAKASTMKVPLHQKRASIVLSQLWGSGRLSQSTQAEIKSEAQVECHTQTPTPTKYQQQTQYQLENSQSETKGTQTKVQSQKETVSRQRLQIQSETQMHYQSQKQTKTMSGGGQRIQEENVFKRAESVANGRSVLSLRFSSLDQK